jgi:hypothetical protein
MPTHPSMTVDISIQAQPYGPAEVRVHQTRNIAAMNLDKPQNLSRQQWNELAGWLNDHVKAAVDEAKQQIDVHATLAREDTASVTSIADHPLS